MTDNPLLPTNFAIIVAGGSGSRMKSAIPKQFLLLNGKPILQHTLEQFLRVRLPNLFPVPSSPTGVLPLQLILVLPEHDQQTWTTLCAQHQFYPTNSLLPILTVNGGASRFQSVQNGLKAIRSADGLVAVHDGVRPFITPTIIQHSFETAARTGSAVTCVPLKDSMRIIHADGSNQAVDRSQYRLIQTPQTFQLNRFRQAFDTEEQPFFTDCASVMEYAGFPITLIEGSYENSKITTPDDLK